MLQSSSKLGLKEPRKRVASEKVSSDQGRAIAVERTQKPDCQRFEKTNGLCRMSL